MSPDAPAVAIVGPTGARKSYLALRVAEEFQGEIVNCDSLQLYKSFDIGTAKLPEPARQGIPHHLFDVLEPHQGYSAGEYARDARVAIAQISARNRVPIVTGGAGFYLRALLHGLPSLPPRDETLRARLTLREKSRPGILHRILSRLDPATAARIHVRDVQKLIRALEIRMLTRGPLPPPSTAEPLRGYRVLQIGLNPDRQQLYEVLDARARAMFNPERLNPERLNPERLNPERLNPERLNPERLNPERADPARPASGLIQEVRDLLAQGCTGFEKPFESLGYKQALAYVRGSATVEQAIASTQLETRQYAKRQLTWLRRDPGVHWLAGFGDSLEVIEQVFRLIRVHSR